MGTVITTLILIALVGGLTYMAKTIVGGNSAARKSRRADGLAKDGADTLPEAPIASHEDVLQFWTAIMNDSAVDIDTRLKASKLLGEFHAGGTGDKTA